MPKVKDKVIVDTVALTMKQLYELNEGRAVQIVTGENLMGDDLVLEIKSPRRVKP